MSSSTILYKFRSGTTFEALPLPGTAARLLDVKKAIVTAKKLDQGSMDFDLSVRDAVTDQEYMDDAALLPRGTRIVVQRLPAARGHGILAKLARGAAGGGGGPSYHQAHAVHSSSAATPSDFYTIDSRAGDDDEEFVSSSAPPSANAATDAPNADSNELAALRAATDTANSQTSGMPSRQMMRGNFRPAANQPAGSGPPPPPPPSSRPNFHQQRHHHQRPNADPELREQELQPKKRQTGIPRTFLDITKAAAAVEGTDGETTTTARIQPNTIGFEELKTRGGGQSENAAGTKRDLDYAIKVTATTIPEYLQCAICHGVVRDAMMLPWDHEGRTTCETCIRDSLAQNGFRCPLTQQEGVSPDDLLPNHALRKAALQFVKGVMEKMEEIDKQQVDEEIAEDDGGDGKNKSNLLEGDSADRGVVLTRRTSAAEKKRKEEDPFGGGDDDFGGDVFAVETPDKEPEMVEDKDEKPVDENAASKSDDTKMEEEKPVPNNDDDAKKSNGSGEAAPKKEESKADLSSPAQSKGQAAVDNKNSFDQTPPDTATTRSSNDAKDAATTSATTTTNSNMSTSRRETVKRRGPPVGYTMGPAGGAAAAGPTQGNNNNYSNGPYSPREAGGRPPQQQQQQHSQHNNHGSYDEDDRSPRGSGGRGRGGFGGRGYGDQQQQSREYDRGVKRSRSASEQRADEGYDNNRYGREEYGGRGGGSYDYGSRGGGPRDFGRGRGRSRGGYRGGRGGWDDSYGRGRGGGYRGGGRGGYRGGRGRY